MRNLKVKFKMLLLVLCVVILALLSIALSAYYMNEIQNAEIIALFGWGLFLD